MRLKVTSDTNRVFEDLCETIEPDFDQPSTLKLINLNEEDTEIQVTDEEGCVVGVIDLTRVQ